MTDEWTIGQGFRSASTQETDSDGQQAGEVEFHGEALQGGKGPGWSQSVTPSSAKGHSGKRVGVKLSTTINGLGPKGVRSPLDADEEANPNTSIAQG